MPTIISELKPSYAHGSNTPEPKPQDCNIVPRSAGSARRMAIQTSYFWSLPWHVMTIFGSWYQPHKPMMMRCSYSRVPNRVGSLKSGLHLVASFPYSEEDLFTTGKNHSLSLVRSWYHVSHLVSDSRHRRRHAHLPPLQTLFRMVSEPWNGFLSNLS